MEPSLSALILRMLSLAPEERGTAGELAEALEALEALAVGAELEVEPARLNVEPAQRLGPPPEEVSSLESGSAPVLSPSPPVRGSTAQEVAPGAEAVAAGPDRSAGVAVSAQSARPPVRRWRWRPGLAMAGVGVLLVLWGLREVHVRREGVSAREQGAAEKGRPDAGRANLGDVVSAAPRASVQEPSRQEAIAQELPPQPRPGQLLPDAKGQCPGRKQMAINLGCWVELSGPDAEECEQNGYVLFKERCYAPALEKRRKPPPTSDQPQ